MNWVTDARLSVKAMGRFLRYLGPRSPLGPGVGGMLSVLLTMLVAWIVAPFFIRATVWWWSLWLSGVR